MAPQVLRLLPKNTRRKSYQRDSHNVLGWMAALPKSEPLDPPDKDTMHACIRSPGIGAVGELSPRIMHLLRFRWRGSLQRTHSNIWALLVSRWGGLKRHCKMVRPDLSFFLGSQSPWSDERLQSPQKKMKDYKMGLDVSFRSSSWIPGYYLLPLL